MVAYLLEEGVRLVYLADSDVSMYIYYMGEVMFLITLRQNRPPKKSSRVRFLNNLKDFLQNSH